MTKQEVVNNFYSLAPEYRTKMKLSEILAEFEQAVREETIETCLDIVFAETYPFDGKVVRVFDDPNVAYKIIKNLLKN